ncbi:hypothetical protein SAMN02745751_01054 [Dethiosulfatibacter aminovorans DSM 17477]|uniref:YprB ribonuclease H-like domain-containing protein n=1 Tax=Dethiosulfatibacter aminovorans DSM 17477 TaxID=1121476 RepID=A0A1M6DV37_9FIRM|nr:ribonuclease H-like domain-containing protein [Dethiosulfatibacter aminovorans]SHI77091.1 hypothetical protein SAMN02745751_01054 [Dethiosulfatibacter aminovorans DSM 17477]
MITREKTIDNRIYNSLIPEAIADDCVFFDIETTGLSKLTSEIFIAGFLYKSGDNYILKQMFSTSSNSEKYLTNEISNILKTKKYIITYNGNSFDIPFYVHRCKINKTDPQLDKKIMLDLYQILSRYKDCLNYVNYKLKTVEERLGILRQDELSGKDLVKLNTSYRMNPKDEYLEIMMLHNFEDIYNLPFIMELVNDFKGKNCLEIERPEFNYLFFDKLFDKKNQLKIRIRTLPHNDIDINVNSFCYKYYWNRNKGLLELEILTSDGIANGKSIKYVNLKDLGFIKTDKYLVMSNEGSPLVENILMLMRLILDRNVV